MEILTVSLCGLLNNAMNLKDTVEDLYRRDLEINPIAQRFERSEYDHFDCENRNSDHILVCLGESWTKGCGLANPHQDVFGAQLSRELGWDWLNCGGSGFSNSWMLSYCEYLVDYLNASDYAGGSVVLTFTENGRDIKDYSSRKFDYISAYQSIPVTVGLYELVLDDIEREWIARLEDISQQLDSRFQLVAGCNFAWHDTLAGFCRNHYKVKWIGTRWLDLLADAVDKPRANSIRMTHVDAPEVVNQIVGIKDSSAFKRWFMMHSDSALNVIGWMESTTEFFESHDTGHPNAQGHAVWANAVKEVLTFDLGVANPSVRPAAGHAP
jgi:lysophospholipase L1-like esterase